MRVGLVFRLTAWYAVIFTVSCILVGAVVYGILVRNLHTRMDEELRDEAREFASIFETETLETFKNDVSREAVLEGIDKIYVRLVNADGTEVVTTDPRLWRGYGLDPLLHEPAHDGEMKLVTLRDPETGNAARVLQLGLDDGRVLQLGLSLKADRQVLLRLRELFLVALVTVAGIAGLGGWFMARRALAGVEAVTRTARSIAPDDMTSRVPVSRRGDEIDRLAATFNDMLDRIDTLVRSMREVNDNIAHDLRSPITRMRASAELTFDAGSAGDPCHTLAAEIVEECDRLLAMINTMLDISEAESGVVQFRKDLVDLADLVREGCELFSTALEDKNITLTVDVPEEPCEVLGDIRWLQRVVGNLLDNAAKYTPSGGRVAVRTEPRDSQVVVTVEDSGPGIAAKDLPRIFDRFYRGDESRTHHGSGLGLSLAKAVVQAHGGTIEAANVAGNGSRFAVVLPRKK